MGVIPARDTGRTNHSGSLLGTGEPLASRKIEGDEVGMSGMESERRGPGRGHVISGDLLKMFLKTTVKVIIASICFECFVCGRSFQIYSFIYTVCSLMR